MTGEREYGTDGNNGTNGNFHRISKSSSVRSVFSVCSVLSLLAPCTKPMPRITSARKENGNVRIPDAPDCSDCNTLALHLQRDQHHPGIRARRDLSPGQIVASGQRAWTDPGLSAD